MILTNQQIYDFTEQIKQAFNDNSKYFPSKINFPIQKNKKLLMEAVGTIDKVKQSIAKQYGVQDLEDANLYHIKAEYIDQAQKELDDLMALEQDLNCTLISFKDIENLEFTSNQMEAIMFMIDEEAE